LLLINIDKFTFDLTNVSAMASSLASENVFKKSIKIYIYGKKHSVFWISLFLRMSRFPVRLSTDNTETLLLRTGLADLPPAVAEVLRTLLTTNRARLSAVSNHLTLTLSAAVHNGIMRSFNFCHCY